MENQGKPSFSRRKTKENQTVQRENQVIAMEKHPDKQNHTSNNSPQLPRNLQTLRKLRLYRAVPFIADCNFPDL
jgi:hypothetical protein